MARLPISSLGVVAFLTFATVAQAVCPPHGSLVSLSESVGAALDERDSAAYAAAIADLRKAVKQAPGCGEPVKRLADALWNGQRRFAKDSSETEAMRAEARRLLAEGQAFAPDDPDLLEGLANLSESPDEQFLWSERLERVAPEHPVVHRILAQMLLGRGQVDRAVAEYTLHLKFAPYVGRESGSLHTGFAMDLLQIGRVADAKMIVLKTLALAADESTFERCWLVQQFSPGPLADSPDLGKTIRELVPYCTNLEHRNEGVRLEQAGKIDQAIAEYRAQIEVNPVPEDTYGFLENLYLRQGRFAEGANVLKALIQREPNAEKRCAAAALADSRYGPMGVSIFAPMKQGCSEKAKPSASPPLERHGAAR
jgi:tetratricopeptide (TPR) repeat protein